MRRQSLALVAAFALAGCSRPGPEPDPPGYSVAIPADVPGEMELIDKDGTRHMGNGRELYAAVSCPRITTGHTGSFPMADEARRAKVVKASGDSVNETPALPRRRNASKPRWVMPAVIVALVVALGSSSSVPRSPTKP